MLNETLSLISYFVYWYWSRGAGFSKGMELYLRVELRTSSLPRKCSTTELLQQYRAENGAQTRDPQLGRLVLYQLSYFRKSAFSLRSGW